MGSWGCVSGVSPAEARDGGLRLMKAFDKALHSLRAFQEPGHELKHAYLDTSVFRSLFMFSEV